MNRMRRAAGFTLIEALIALAIFAFLGVGSYQLLDSTGRLMASGEQRFAAVSDTQVALRLLEEDFSQLSARPVAAAGGGFAPALNGAPQDGVVEFTRSGWRNPLGMARSRLQRVRWEVDAEGRLLRHYRGEIDGGPDSREVVRGVASGVESLELRYLDAKGDWAPQWPPRPASPKPEDDTIALLPRAIEIHLVHTQIGEVTRLVSLR